MNDIKMEHTTATSYFQFVLEAVETLLIGINLGLLTLCSVRICFCLMLLYCLTQ
jgi:hypothetical protein